MRDAAVRVLYLAPPPTEPGRLSRYSFLDEEIRAIAARGVHVYVLTRLAGTASDDGCVHVRVIPPDSPRERFRALAFLARQIHRLPLPNLLDPRECYRVMVVERFAAELIQKERIDLVHSYFGWPRGYGGQLAAAATRRPLVAGLRGADVNVVPALEYGSRLNASFDRALRRLLQRAARTIFVSEFLRRQGHALGASPQRSQVILKGVRLDQFAAAPDRAEARRAVGAGPDPMILAVAGLVPIKGLAHVLDALAIVKASGRRFSFVVCGEGPERDALERQARNLGLGEQLTLRGRVARDQIARYFAAADLFVHGSIIEASGNVLLEAMASALPVVCTNAGGPAEYVTDGVDGFVVPVADPRAMAERIAQLLDDGELRKTFGTNGRARALNDLAYDRMIDETLAVYRALTRRSRTSAAI